ITQVSMYLMNFFDTVMSGRFGAVDLAGVAIGSSLWVPVFTGINGVIIALTPIIVHLSGAKEMTGITQKVYQGIYISIVLSIIVIIAGRFLIQLILNTMDIEVDVSHIAKFYLIAHCEGIVPLYIFNTLLAFIDALGKSRTSMIIILWTLPIN